MNNPFVSVIIPVFNNAQRLVETLNGLRNQDYPKERFEIIVIDNGSQDKSLEIAKSFPGVITLTEHTYKGSPYSARNRGLEKARGDVLALIDATCVPERAWIKNAIERMKKEGTDLVGGEVKFELNGKQKALNIYESLVTIRVKESVLERQASIGGNLFIARKVYETIGPFPEGLRSGGDTIWTRKAHEHGFRISYGEDSVVYIKPRPFFKLYKKIARLGRAKVINNPRHYSKSDAIKIFILSFRPHGLSTIDRLITTRGNDSMIRYRYSLWAYHNLTRVVQGISQFLYLIRN